MVFVCVLRNGKRNGALFAAQINLGETCIISDPDKHISTYLPIRRPSTRHSSTTN